MKKKYIYASIILICLIGISLFFYLCINKSEYANTIPNALNKANIKYDDIIKILNKKTITFIFYTHEGYINVATFQKDPFGWEYMNDYGSVNINSKLEWNACNLYENGKLFTLVYGYILDSEIKDIYIIPDNNKQLSVQKVNAYGGKLWFAQFNKINTDKFNILAITKYGDKIHVK